MGQGMCVCVCVCVMSELQMLFSQVSLNSEAAMHIVSAVSDLSKVKVRSHIDKLCDLLLKAQELTFMDMLPYWGAFCKQYKSPDGSVVSLPPGE